MKKFMRFLCAAMLLVSFAACTGEENPSDDPADDNNYSTLIVGKWQVDQMLVNEQDMTPQNMQLTFNQDGSGLMEDGGEATNNDFTWAIGGSTITVTTHNSQFTFTIDNLTETKCTFHGSLIELDGNEMSGEIRFHMTKVTGGNPDTPDPGNLGLSDIDPAGRTETTITVNSTITGDINQYLPQFPNFTCGFIWSAEAYPTMDGNSITGTPDQWGKFEVTITGLEPGKDYMIIAWLKLTTESTPIFSNSIVISTLGGSNPGLQWINLGLPSGLLWASCNVGATAPEEYGNYFAWGETQPKSDYSWSTYAHCSNGYLIKYCNNAEYGLNGYTDNRTILEPSDDAATAKIGNGARTPTKEEWDELINNTTAEWTTLNGVHGRRFTATNGNSIFLPAAGSILGSELQDPDTFSQYWSSTLYPNSPNSAWHFYFRSDNQNMNGYTRTIGCTVRAVKSAK